MDIYRIQNEPIVVEEALHAISDPATGGEALFLGTVRNHFDGRESQGLFYEAYAELAEMEMGRIGQELKERFGVSHVVMIHRTGELTLGEVAVVVAISSAHREAAMLACHQGIDEIKRRVPIWKKERWADGPAGWHHDPRESSN